MPSACVGQQIYYGIGTVDPNGDSLRFELTPAKTGTGANVSYTGGYTYLRPMTQFSMDSATGLITARSTVAGKFLVAFLVKEYERCDPVLKGRLKGVTYREVQFVVSACSNNVPRDISGVSNITGQAMKLGRFKIEVCEGQTFGWDDTLQDPDVLDTLYISTNMQDVLPGATVQYISLNRRTTVARFSWRAVIGGTSIVKSFFLEFNDNRCDYPGKGFSVFEIIVKPATSAGPDQNVCIGDTVMVDAVGGTAFTWTSISGDPLISGVNWFPLTLGYPGQYNLFRPSQTTYLQVASNAQSPCGGSITSCFTVDTIRIHPVDSFSLATVPDMFLCNPASGQLDVTPSKSQFTYSYEWGPNKNLSSNTVKNPTFSGLNVDRRYYVTVSSDSGCVRTDSVDIGVSDPFPTNMKLLASDTLICLQDTVDLWMNLGSVNYGVVCDTPVYQCQGVARDIIGYQGALQNSGTAVNYPVVYNNYYFGTKTQIIYRASDLKARGIKAGPLDGIAFQILSLSSAGATPFNGFTIKVGCTPDDKFTSGDRNFYQGAMVQVFDPKAVTPSVGWNQYNFDRLYVWDGTSNLVVDVCWDNTTRYIANNHVMGFINTTYPATQYYYSTSSAAAACGQSMSNNTTYPAAVIPNTRFSTCSGVDANRYNFSWVSNGSNSGFMGATNRDSIRASVNLLTDSIYTVYISDKRFGVCHDTFSIKVKVVSEYNTKPDTLPSQCMINGFIKFTSKTPYWITKPGGRWSGAGIVNDTLGLWDPLISGQGNFYVKYRVTGDACESEDSTMVHIVGLPDPSIIEPTVICGYSKHDLIGALSGGYFSGIGVDSSNIGGVRKYWVDGKKYKPSRTNPDTALIQHRIYRGCWHDTIYKIPVVAPFDSTYMGIYFDGRPQLTSEFCRTGDIDSLMWVDMPRGFWYSPSHPGIIDSVGRFNPGLASTSKPKGNTDLVTVRVVDTGFCGTSNTLTFAVLDPPYFEVVDKNYCLNESRCSGIATLEQYDTIRIAYPNFSSTNGLPYDTVVHVDNTVGGGGWNISSNDLETRWDMPNVLQPQSKTLFRYRWCDKNPGKYSVYYQVGMNTNHPSQYCARRDTGIMDFAFPPKAPLLTGDEYNFCARDSVNLLEAKTARPEERIEWYFTPDELDSATAFYLGSPLDKSMFQSKSGSYFVKSRNPTGCLSTATEVPYYIRNYPNVAIDSNHSGGRIVLGSQNMGTYVNASQNPDKKMTYWWGQGLGKFNPPFEIPSWEPDMNTQHNETSEANATLNIDFTGYQTSDPQFSNTYPLILLIGVDQYGCSDTTWVYGTIDRLVQPTFPNVFTPNGDFTNDWWSILNPKDSNRCKDFTNGCYENEDYMKSWYRESFDNIEGFIYDRWGRKMYELTIDEPFWKGANMSGNDVADGVYFVVLEYTLNDMGKTTDKYEGTITLIRGKD
jgi:hypothetical protein